MLRDITSFKAIYIACGRVDLRKGIDGLASIVKEQFDLNPFQKDVLFLFCGRKQDRWKGLVWEGTGFTLLYHRIEAGHVQWPRNGSEMAQLTLEDYHRLLDGFAVLQKPTIRESDCTEIS